MRMEIERFLRQFEWNWTVMGLRLKVGVGSEPLWVVWLEAEGPFVWKWEMLVPWNVLFYRLPSILNSGLSEKCRKNRWKWVGNNFKWVGRVLCGKFYVLWYSNNWFIWTWGLSSGLGSLKIQFLVVEIFFCLMWFFLTCLFSVPNLLESVEYSNKTVFWVWIFILEFFYWTSPPRQAVLTKNISVNFVNLEHSVEWSEYFGMVICHVGVLEHSRNNSRNIHQESIFSINGIWQNRAIFCRIFGDSDWLNNFDHEYTV